jgi:hypothetical protein
VQDHVPDFHSGVDSFEHGGRAWGRFKNLGGCVDMVVHACNPSTLEVEIRRIKVLGQPGQKVSRTPISTNKLGMVCACNPSYMGGTGRRILV